MDDLLVHDEAAEEPTLAYLLSRMTHPDFPEPVGVFRAVEQPTFEAQVTDQIDGAIKARAPASSTSCSAATTCGRSNDQCGCSG